MKADRFYNEFRQALRESLFLKFTLSIVILVVIGQFLALITLLKHQRIILVPTSKFSKEVVISDDEVSPEYIRIFIRDAIRLYTNFTPKDIESRYKELLGYISPEYYHTAEVFLLKRAKQFEDAGISQTGYIRSIEITNKDTAIVRAYINRFIAGELIQSKEKIFVVKFHFSGNGRFYIDLIKEIKPDEVNLYKRKES